MQAGATLGEHPDPNLLSAFAERSLAKGEQVNVLEHLSRCVSCREIVSLAVNQPGFADAVSAVRVGPSWLSWPVLRWGAAVACVLVVGAAVTLRERQESRQFVGAIAEKSVTGTTLPVPESTVEKTVASLQIPKPETKVALGNKQAGGGQKAIRQNENLTSEVVPGRAKEASQSAQAAQGLSTPGDEGSLPENPVPRWTLSSDGTLQRSLDSGRSWQTIPVSSQTIFRALAANGQDIWVGGAAGTLLHSSDAGQHWMQVRPTVNGEVLADDIIGVEFRDGLHGKLTSARQETWITADAGQTWQKH
jgi:hypothetical protein